MAYLGRQLSSGNYLKLDDISSQFNGSTTTFNLTSGGQPFYPGSSYALHVSLGGVIQEPESAYTIDRNTITFASAPGSTDDFFCVPLGLSLGINVPADGTVSKEKLQDSAVTFAKIAPAARGVGIQSGGVVVGAAITQLNFVGVGNTFAVNGTTIDISIQSGAGGTWTNYAAGIATTRSGVGINTNNLDDKDLTGIGNSFNGLYISNGMFIMDNTLNGNHYIGTNFNGLMAGPVTVNGSLTVDGVWVVV